MQFAHPTLGLGADAVPGFAIGPQQGVSVVSGPILPLAAAGFAFWVGSKAHVAVGIVGGLLAYYAARVGLAAWTGHDIRQTA